MPQLLLEGNLNKGLTGAGRGGRAGLSLPALKSQVLIMVYCKAEFHSELFTCNSQSQEWRPRPGTELGGQSASFKNLGFTQWKPLARFLSRKMTLCRGELWLRWREQSEEGRV